MAEVLCTAKNKNIDLQWKEVVQSLLIIGEQRLTESVCRMQGGQQYFSVYSCEYAFLHV